MKTVCYREGNKEKIEKNSFCYMKKGLDMEAAAVL